MSKREKYNRVRFSIPKREMRKKVINSTPFKNWIMEEHPGEFFTNQRYYLIKEWESMSLKEKNKYSIIKKDGTINLQKLMHKYEVRKALAFQ